MNGVLYIDKPPDYTSFDVVAVVRRLSGPPERRAAALLLLKEGAPR